MRRLAISKHIQTAAECKHRLEFSHPCKPDMDLTDAREVIYTAEGAVGQSLHQHTNCQMDTTRGSATSAVFAAASMVGKLSPKVKR